MGRIDRIKEDWFLYPVHPAHPVSIHLIFLSFVVLFFVL